MSLKWVKTAISKTKDVAEGKITKDEALIAIEKAKAADKPKTIFGKAIKGIANVAGSVIKTALPAVAAIVAGPVGATAVGNLVSKIGETKAGQIVDAVANKGYVNVNSIKNTVQSVGQTISESEVKTVADAVSKIVKEQTGSKPKIISSLTTTEATQILPSFPEILEESKQTGVVDKNSLQTALVEAGNYTENLFKSLLDSLNRQVNGDVENVTVNNSRKYWIIAGAVAVIGIVYLIIKKK